MNTRHEVLLPTRDYLRQLIGQPQIRPGEIKSILRARGVFTSSDQKDLTGPLLIKTGISPAEYLDLRETYRTKEESPKSKTRTISWQSEASLLDCIPEDIAPESIINDQFGVVGLSKFSDFVAMNDDPNHIYLDFELSRRDSISNWGENITYHSGRVELKQEVQTKSLTIALTHTSQETIDFGNRIAEAMISHFKQSGHISSASDVIAVRFNDFCNEGRISFLRDFSQKPGNRLLKFVDTSDIHFSPDDSIPNPPESISWMREKIADLKMKGNSLHSTFFVTDVVVHPFIQMFGLQCEYSFDIEECKGVCRIIFEFPEKDDPKKSELTLNISIAKIESNEDGIPRLSLVRKITDSLEQKKMELYNRYKITPEASQST